MVGEINNDINKINFRVSTGSYEGKLNQGRVILSTIRGSCPLNRRLGLNSMLIDKPSTFVERGIFSDIHSQFEEFAPDLTLIDVAVNNLENGLEITCSVEVSM